MSTNTGVVVAGVVYGIAVWLMMNELILPLTQAKVSPVGSAGFWIQLAWHPFGIGIPIVAINRSR